MLQTVNTARPYKGRKFYKRTEISGNTPMWFGRYEGWPLAAVPPDYLLYVYDNFRVLNPALKRWIATWKRYFSTQVYLAR